jgi:hypothetical protein
MPATISTRFGRWESRFVVLTVTTAHKSMPTFVGSVKEH